jgi:hypothetical protein
MSQNDRTVRRARLALEQLEVRAVPSTLHGAHFHEVEHKGSGSVEVRSLDTQRNDSGPSSDLKRHTEDTSVSLDSKSPSRHANALHVSDLVFSEGIKDLTSPDSSRDSKKDSSVDVQDQKDSSSSEVQSQKNDSSSAEAQTQRNDG